MATFRGGFRQNRSITRHWSTFSGVGGASARGDRSGRGGADRPRWSLRRAARGPGDLRPAHAARRAGDGADHRRQACSLLARGCGADPRAQRGPGADPVPGGRPRALWGLRLPACRPRGAATAEARRGRGAIAAAGRDRLGRRGAGRRHRPDARRVGLADPDALSGRRSGSGRAAGPPVQPSRSRARGRLSDRRRPYAAGVRSVLAGRGGAGGGRGRRRTGPAGRRSAAGRSAGAARTGGRARLGGRRRRLLAGPSRRRRTPWSRPC